MGCSRGARACRRRSLCSGPCSAPATCRSRRAAPAAPSTASGPRCSSRRCARAARPRSAPATTPSPPCSENSTPWIPVIAIDVDVNVNYACLMTDLSDSAKLVYKAKHKIRFVTAASLFDGHDASINIMRRILQASGAEVIHLGHNRSVQEIVTAALQEDVQGVAVSSYQGGHIEFFKYMVDLLRQRGGAHIQVFGGGGGVIVPAEIKELQDYGVARIYSPEDGQRMGLQGMINDMLARCDFNPARQEPKTLAQVITALELGVFKDKNSLLEKAKANPAPV